MSLVINLIRLFRLQLAFRLIMPYFTYGRVLSDADDTVAVIVFAKDEDARFERRFAAKFYDRAEEQKE